MRVVVAGGRNVLECEQNIRLAALALLDIKATEVISGCSHGADACGEMAAARLGLVVKLRPADFKRHGKSAMALRNERMATEAHACILFPGDAETDSMRAEAEKRNLTIVNIHGATLKGTSK